MKAAEAVKHLPISEFFLERICGDREYDMVEIVALRSELAFNKLDLMNRFYFADQREEAIIKELMEL